MAKQTKYLSGLQPDGGYVIDDSDNLLPTVSPVCHKCKHLQGHRRCKAFPREDFNRPIPFEIWNGDDPHTEAWEGDHDIRFTKGTPKFALQ